MNDRITDLETRLFRELRSTRGMVSLIRARDGVIARMSMYFEQNFNYAWPLWTTLFLLCKYLCMNHVNHYIYDEWIMWTTLFLLYKYLCMNHMGVKMGNPTHNQMSLGLNELWVDSTHFVKWVGSTHNSFNLMGWVVKWVNPFK